MLFNKWNKPLMGHFKTIPSRSSRFKLYQYPNLLLLQCTVRLETKSLTVPDLSTEHSSRLSEVWELSKLGISTLEISKIFNEKGYQRGSGKLVELSFWLRISIEVKIIYLTKIAFKYHKTTSNPSNTGCPR